MALRSEKESCRKCGGPLEPGFIRGDAGFSVAASMCWEPVDPGSLPGDFPTATRLAPLPLIRWQQSPRFPALLCPACRLIEFQLTEAARPASHILT
jgi:hypothetical protein